MKIIDEDNVTPQISEGVALKVLLQKKIDIRGTLSFGTVMIPPNKRVPSKGESVHKGDEYSLILKGSIHTMSGGHELKLTEGQAGFIPAGESHWALNDGNNDCVIVWVLVEPE